MNEQQDVHQPQVTTTSNPIPGADSGSSPPLGSLTTGVGNRAFGEQLARSGPAGGHASSPPGDHDAAIAVGLARSIRERASGKLLRDSPGGAPASEAAIKQRAQELGDRTTAQSARAAGIQQGIVGIGEECVTAVDGMANSMSTICETYDEAYKRFSGVLKQAGKNAQTRDELIDAAIGVVIGLAVGGVLGPVAKRVEKYGVIAVKAFDSAQNLTETLGGKGAEQGTGPARERRDEKLNEPNVARPEVKKVEAWQKIAGLYRNLSGTKGVLSNIPDLQVAATKINFDCGKLAGSGKPEPPDLTVDALTGKVRKLEGAAGALEQARESAQQTLEALHQTADSLVDRLAATSASDIEARLWRQWIASLPRDVAQEVLDDNDIEQRLEQLGLKGADSPIGFDTGADAQTDDIDKTLAVSAALEALRGRWAGRRVEVANGFAQIEGESYVARGVHDGPAVVSDFVVDKAQFAGQARVRGKQIFVVCQEAPLDLAEAPASEPVKTP